MAEAAISEEKAKGIRRLLLVTIGFAAVLVLCAALLVGNDYRGYAVVVLLIAVALGGSAWVSMRALREQSPSARRACILTGVLLLLLSVPLVPIGIGLLTAVTGIGVLVVVFAPEHAAS
jgi:hypothetical protein